MTGGQPGSRPGRWKTLREEKAGWKRRLPALAGILAALGLVFLLVRGCVFMPWNRSRPAVEVRITVCRNFGGEILKDVVTEVEEGSTALLALQKVAEVGTAYGGGFINSVDGIASRYTGLASPEKKDWFFYVDGGMSPVGAAEYSVRRGDWLIFDFHGWEYSLFTPFLAGCFPYPLRGVEEAAVAYVPGWEEEAREIARALGEAGVECRAVSLEGGWERRGGEGVIVLGEHLPLAELYPPWGEANANPRRWGLYAYFEGEEMVVVDQAGRESGRWSQGVGLVEGVGPRLGEEGSFLAVTGCDAAGVEEAVRLLLERMEGKEAPDMVLAARSGEGELEVPGEGAE